MSVKRDLLEAEDRGWHQLSDRLKRLSDEDWTRPGVNGEWCVKDLIAHIALWHASAADRIEAHRSTGSLPPLPAPVDAINAEQYERSRDLSVKEARAMAGAARHRFREEIAQLPDDPGEKLAMLIYGDGSEHYEEHIPQLDAFLGGAS